MESDGDLESELSLGPMGVLTSLGRMKSLGNPRASGDLVLMEDLLTPLNLASAGN